MNSSGRSLSRLPLRIVCAGALLMMGNSALPQQKDPTSFATSAVESRGGVSMGGGSCWLAAEPSPFW